MRCRRTLPPLPELAQHQRPQSPPTQCHRPALCKRGHDFAQRSLRPPPRPAIFRCSPFDSRRCRALGKVHKGTMLVIPPEPSCVIVHRGNHLQSTIVHHRSPISCPPNPNPRRPSHLSPSHPSPSSPTTTPPEGPQWSTSPPNPPPPALPKPAPGSS